MTVQESPTRPEPTEDRPDEGQAALLISERRVVLSEGEWWVGEDGEYVIRSTEFDVMAGGASFREALAKFCENVTEFGFYLSQLEDRAENEEEMYAVLAPRLLRASAELERCLDEVERLKSRFISINLPTKSRNRHDLREWLPPPSRQPGSPLPLPA